MNVEIPLEFDNTRISTFRTCPRKYYYRHVRHWRGLGTSPALAFGSAWHDAMDQVWKLSAESNSVSVIHEEAFGAFLNKWQEEGMPLANSLEEQERLAPRTPGIGSEMLWNYIDKRLPFLKTIELIEAEKPFMITFSDPGLPRYIGRIDKVFRDEVGNVKLGEHKTTSLYAVKGGVQNSYLESFSPSSQVDGYFFATRREMNLNAVACLVDISLVHKKHHGIFKFLPVTRNAPAIENWEMETISWIDFILGDYSSLQRLEPDEPMHCFPRNTDSCYDFFTPCPYLDLCRFKDKPHCIEETPSNLMEEKWEPFDVLGFKPEDRK